MRTNDCDSATRAGRMGRAREFLAAAGLILDLTGNHTDELTSAYVTLVDRAGIAAADVLCCARLGVNARGESHDQAVTLLRSVDRALAADLSTLLGLKTKAGYTAHKVGRPDLVSAQRAVEKLIVAAEPVV